MDRNYLQEARAILGGTSLLLPTTEHLAALAEIADGLTPVGASLLRHSTLFGDFSAECQFCTVEREFNGVTISTAIQTLESEQWTAIDGRLICPRCRTSSQAMAMVVQQRAEKARAVCASHG